MTDAATYAENAEIAGFWETIKGIIPENPFDSLVSGNILQILFFALFFGIALSVMSKEKQRPVIEILDTVNEGMIWMIQKILVVAPIGVFGLMVNSIALFGMDIMRLVLGAAGCILRDPGPDPFWNDPAPGDAAGGNEPVQIPGRHEGDPDSGICQCILHGHPPGQQAGL